MQDSPSSGVPPRVVAALAEGYELERELGRGGMAHVYLARDRRHDRKVAIKVLRPELASGVTATRFLREINIAARLQHPHILTLIDSGEARPDDGESPLLYYVMPYVEGESLRARIERSGALPVAETLHVLRGVVNALTHAHRHGVLHRDIKPENVMLADQHALVVDFGIARALNDATYGVTLTATGVSLGTPAYMAPEQITGTAEADARTDLYAVGALAFDMLTGHAPFTGSQQSVLASHLAVPAPDIASIRADVPVGLTRIVARCLEKEPSARFTDASELLSALDALAAPAAPARRSSTRWYMAAAAGVLAIGVVFGYGVVRERERWVHGTAVPLVRELAEQGRTDSAFVVASRAAAILPRDSIVQSLWPLFTYMHAFRSEPAGARVYRARFDDTTRWQFIGTTPTDTVPVPQAYGRYRFELPGHRPLTLLGGGLFVLDAHVISGSALPQDVVLAPVDAPDDGMVRVAGPVVTVDGESHQLDAFLIDRHEVTNRQYKDFVDAGGYRNRDYWTEPYLNDGQEVSWEQAMALLVDRTGRPGPATWEGGAPVPDQLDRPVGGVSWYEAAAYARFRDRQLPTVHHWRAAAVMPAAGYTVPGSNFESSSSRPGSAFAGMSPWGVFDMAGNVREWCLNEDGVGNRHILGGAWTDPGFRFTDPTTQSPTDRSAANGIRLVRYADSDHVRRLAMDPVTRPQRDYAEEEPVSDDVFATYRVLYDYDPLPLDVRVETRDTSHADWVRETISFAAGYGRERMQAVLLLPKRFEPPHQTIVVFGGSNALFERSLDRVDAQLFSFLMRSGRAVLVPAYKGTYGRTDPALSFDAAPTVAFRDAVLSWGKDVRRAVDLVVEHPQLDSSRVAYLGLSLGGRMAGVMLAIEPRFEAAVLVVAGMTWLSSRPEVDPLHFLPRVRTPTLMLNGRYDDVFRLQASQLPFFRLLGTAAEHKRHVLYDEGHWVPRDQFISESLSWLDRYLGAGTRQ